MDDFLEACLYGETQKVKLLFQIDNNHVNIDKGLQLACLRRHIDIIKFLISNGANVNSIGSYGKTPLHYVFSESRYIDTMSINHIEIVELVLNETNLNIRTKFGESVLDLAENQLRNIKYVFKGDRSGNIATEQETNIAINNHLKVIELLHLWTTRVLNKYLIDDVLIRIHKYSMVKFDINYK